MVHPDRVVDAEGLAQMPLVEPVYGLTEGLAPRALGKIIGAALARLPELPDWLADTRAEPPNLPGFTEALAIMHHPPEPRRSRRAPARLRLAYDELLAHQLALALARAICAAAGPRPQRRGTLATRSAPLCPSRSPARRRPRWPKSAPISPRRAHAAAAARRCRLGQDVVALLAMTEVVEAGRQAALMAPTEMLARQHFEMHRAAGRRGPRVALLTGRDKGARARRRSRRSPRARSTSSIGTHALFQESVAFRDLGLAVVDEQHRFGVHQRLALGGKGEAADILVMTATPIPRTLVLTYFGDMDVSTLREKPPGRQADRDPRTAARRIDEVVARLQGAVARGARAYWVCPLVAESEAARRRGRRGALRSAERDFRCEVGLVHGKMKGTDATRRWRPSRRARRRCWWLRR